MTETATAEGSRVGTARSPVAPMALVGPTAAGKTEAGVELARRLGAEILVVDSLTVYRGMEVGTAKPTAAQRSRVRHHLLDLADPGEPFSVVRYQAAARAVLTGLRARDTHALLVGGSGLYLRAVADDLAFPGTDPNLRYRLEAEARAVGPALLHRRLQELDPAAAAKIEPANVRRTVRALEVAALTGRPFSSYAVAWDRFPADRLRAAGVAIPPPALDRRIEARVEAMLDGGLIEEVTGLVERGLGPFLTSSRAIGYLEVAEHLDGLRSAEEMVAAMVRRTRTLARRQMAWFRRDPRIRWFEAGEGGAIEVIDRMEEHLRG